MTLPPSPPALVTIVENKVNEATSAGSSSVCAWYSASWRPILAELLATTLLLLLGCMTNIPIDGLPYQNPLYGPLGFGFVVMFNIQIFGHLSGAHMNPSVTLAAVIWGSISIPTAIGYFVAQCVGATLGYSILQAIAPYDLVPGGVCVTQLHSGLAYWQAVCIEIALTSALNFLNCGVWDPVNNDRADSVPLKFALAIAGLSMAGGPLTGASMNPARSLGPVIVTGLWKDHWVYWVGPLIGGVLPTVFYKYVFVKNDKVKADETE